MKILHTSDWHVGKTIRGRSRVDEHRAVLDEIVEIVDTHKVDLVLVAGDLFETAAPTPEAEEIVYSTLLRLSSTDAEVVAVAGNHDNPWRLQAVAPLFARAGVTVQAHTVPASDGGVIEAVTKGGDARVALLPFVSQRGIIRAHDLMERDAAEHNLEYAGRLSRVISALCEGFDSDAVNVLVSHCMCVGGLLGGGERSAQTFIEYAVPHTAFPPSAHYVALGHLHRTQKVSGACPIHYCGSPLQLDFGETKNDPHVLVVDAMPKKPARVEAIPLTEGRRLRTVSGPLDQLQSMTEIVGDDFLRVMVEEEHRPGLADEVRQVFPNAVDVIVQAPVAAPGKRARTRDNRNPEELFSDYLASKGEETKALLPLFKKLYEEAHASA